MLIIWQEIWGVFRFSGGMSFLLNVASI